MIYKEPEIGPSPAPLDEKSTLEHLLLSLSGNTLHDMCLNWDGSNGLPSKDEVITSLPAGATSIDVNVEVDQNLLTGFDFMLGALSKCIARYDLVHGTALGKSLHMPLVKTLFHARDLMGKSETVVGMLGEANQHNWMVYMTGRYHEREENTIVKLSIVTHCTPQLVQDQIARLNDQWSKRYAEKFHRSLLNLQKKMPVHLRAQFASRVIDGFKGMELFEPLIAARDRQQLSDSVADTLDRRPPKM